MATDDDLKMEAAKMAADAIKDKALDTLQGITEEKDDPEEEKSRKLKLFLMIGGGIVGVLVFFVLLEKVFRWAIGLGFLGLIGYGVYALLKPKFKAIGAKKRERLALEEADRAEAQKTKLLEDKKQSLEDDLAALKAQIDS